MKNVIHEEIIRSFKSIFPHHVVYLDSLVFVVLTLKKTFEDTRDFTFIDIGEKYATVHIINDATIRRSESFNFGTQQLIDTLMTKGKMERVLAVSELGMFLEGTCTPAQCSKIEKLLTDTEKHFVELFGDVCTQLNQTYRLPTRAFVLVDPLYAGWLTTIIGRLDFSQFTITGHSLEVSAITPESDTHRIHFLHTRHHRKDSALALCALFAAVKHQGV